MDINDWLCGQVNLLQRPVSFQPFKHQRFEEIFLIAIYDPFKQVNLEYDILMELEELGWMDEIKEFVVINEMNIFDNPWIATKILRTMFTPNFYCFRDSDEVTSGLGILYDLKEALKVQEWLRKYGLSSVIYSERKIEGWKRVHIQKEPWDYKASMIKPHHLNIKQSFMRKNYSNIPRFTNFYYKMERVQAKIREEVSNVEDLIQRLRWSWMCFLLPIAQDENSISVLELTNYLVNEVDNVLNVKASLKLILNILKCHPIQLAGTTNLVCFSHKLNGTEMCFSFFRYIYDDNIKQWITQEKLSEETDFNEEMLKCWSYENDWPWLNDLQKMVLETFIYAERLENYPYDIPKTWKNYRENIQNRQIYDRGKDLNRSYLVPLTIQLLRWLK